jgi:tripartite ATP-independent transporter DctP family solute receptor
MMTVKRREALGLMAGSMGAFISGCRGRDLNRPLLATDHHPEGYPTVEAVKHMGELLSARTDGRLNVKMFAGGQLGSERDTLEITTFGGLDINRVAIAPLNAIEPMTIVPSLPFLFRSTQHMRKALDGPAGEAILESLKPHDLIGLCFYDSGERCFYNTKQPILTPDDMKGMKIRVQNSDLYVSMIKALGADATPMSLGEVYQSLVQGVIDGAENNWPSYQSGRHFEAAPYYSLTRHVMAPEVLVMSASRWKKLSPADQKVVKQAAKDSVPFMRNLWDKRVNDARAALLDAGVKANEVSDLSAFSAKMRPVWDRFLVTNQQKAIVKSIENMEV